MDSRGCQEQLIHRDKRHGSSTFGETVSRLRARRQVKVKRETNVVLSSLDQVNKALLDRGIVPEAFRLEHYNPHELPEPIDEAEGEVIDAEVTDAASPKREPEPVGHRGKYG
jgi:hypothetical protein